MLFRSGAALTISAGLEVAAGCVGSDRVAGAVFVGLVAGSAGVFGAALTISAGLEVAAGCVGSDGAADAVLVGLVARSVGAFGAASRPSSRLAVAAGGDGPTPVVATSGGMSRLAGSTALVGSTGTRVADDSGVMPEGACTSGAGCRATCPLLGSVVGRGAGTPVAVASGCEREGSFSVAGAVGSA